MTLFMIKESLCIIRSYGIKSMLFKFTSGGIASFAPLDETLRYVVHAEIGEEHGDEVCTFVS